MMLDLTDLTGHHQHAACRFANELGTRDYLTGKMLEADPEKREFVLLIHSEVASAFDCAPRPSQPAQSAKQASTHTALYTQKGLLRAFNNLAELGAWIEPPVPADTLQATLLQYNKHAKQGACPDDKTVFKNTPFPVVMEGTTGPVYYAGLVTPALHYSMGGLSINPSGQVLDTARRVIPGLYAAGELTGGIHGRNRLGGNALTECVVYGRKVGLSVPLRHEQSHSVTHTAANPVGTATEQWRSRMISPKELKKHNSRESCWIALSGVVYDFTDFIDEHPAGPEALLEYAGADGTAKFEAVHNKEMLDDFQPLGSLQK